MYKIRLEGISEGIFSTKSISEGILEGIFYWRKITKGLSKVDVIQAWTAK